MMVYTPLQQKWLKHHYTKWQREYAWSAGEFAKRVKQRPADLAEVIDVPLEEFGPLPEVAEPITPPSAVFAAPELPAPGSETVIVSPGMEWLPAQKAPAPPPAAPREPFRQRAWVRLSIGKHIVDGVEVDIVPPADNPNALFVYHEVDPHVRHVVDGKNAVLQMNSMLQVYP